MLVSSSWDKTTRVWDTFERKGTTDTLTLSSDCTAVVASPDNSQVSFVALSSCHGNMVNLVISLGK